MLFTFTVTGLDLPFYLKGSLDSKTVRCETKDSCSLTAVVLKKSYDLRYPFDPKRVYILCNKTVIGLQSSYLTNGMSSFRAFMQYEINHISMEVTFHVGNV